MLKRSSKLGQSAARLEGRIKPSSRWLAPLLLILTAIALAGCKVAPFYAYRSADRQGGQTLDLWSGFVIAALVVGTIVLVLIFAALLLYRRRPDDDGSLPKQTRYNLPWEIAYTVTPFLIVVGLFYFTVKTENFVDATPKNPTVQVKVTAYRWGWIFDYQGTPVAIHTTTNGAGSFNYPTMVLPENRQTEITLVSADVVHEFWVPKFLFGRYAQPGITNHFDFKPTALGTFKGRCDFYCGLYHAEMRFYVRVVPPTTFTSWLHSQETAAKAGTTT